MVPYVIDTTVACSATSQSIHISTPAATGPIKNGHMENGVCVCVSEREKEKMAKK